MVDFYLKCRSVSEVMKFYLTQNTVTGVGATDGTAVHGPYRDADLFNLVGSFSLEFKSKLMEEWREILERNRGTGVILLLGAAGGLVVYLIRRRNTKHRPARESKSGNLTTASAGRGTNNETSSRRRPRYQKQTSFWNWLFEEEVVEDLSKDAYLLRSHYFGPVSGGGAVSLGAPGNDWSYLTPSPIPNKFSADSEPVDHDVSLNSFTCETTPRKFLKAPLLFDIRRHGQTRHCAPSRQQSRQVHQNQMTVSRCNPCPRCVKGTCRIKRHQVYHQQHHEESSGSSSALSSSPINQFDKKHIKTSTPDNFGLEHSSDKLSSGHFQGSCRLDGDGSDETEDPSLHLSEDLARYSATPLGVNDRQYRPTRFMFGSGKRGAPDGKERVSTTPSPPGGVHNSDSSPMHPSSSSGAPQTTPERLTSRDDFSGDSDMDHLSCEDSVSGSMLDFVQDAREIRRLIREVSIDSNASDLSLGLYLPDDHSAQQIEGITKGLDELIFNCANLDGDALEPSEHQSMSTSKSSTSGLYQYASHEEEHAHQNSDEESLKRDGSIPDLRNLQTTLKKSAKGLWKLTNITGMSEGSRQASVLSDSGGSMEWESPLHGLGDYSRKLRYRTPVLSSNVSECSMDDLCSLAGSCLDQWEWDEAAYYISGGEEDDEKIVMSGHSTWLPDIGSTELDLETELRFRDASMGPFNSARSSLEPELARLPPSGRSSAERFSSSRRLSASSRGSSISDDVTLMSCANKLNTSRLTRSRSRDRNMVHCSADLDSSACDNMIAYHNMSHCGLPPSVHHHHSLLSSSADTSGISSMNSSMMSSSTGSSLLVSSINLSPVKEAPREEVTVSPSRSSAVVSPTVPLLSPSSPSGSDKMEISIGNIRTTDTVIKVQLPEQSGSTRPGDNSSRHQTKSKASTALFKE